ncbi:hypothetical protein EGW08_004827 [Elysia chlorotica]|uniref:Retrotransposon gag domain-containing protein n=1 Tax=Elysia chlorotica TaxID=188477 RepID=A0A3S1BFX6_ELYCH|nr:hypothetical protein EGW08_004827 [Elysia chlorotica]
MPYIKIEAFDGNIDTFENYSETLEQYFLANDIDERKRAPALLSGIGAKTYQLLRSLLTPDLPSTKSYEELKQITNEHLSPKPLEIAKRFRFQKRNQREGESIQTYCAEIKRLTQHCGFAQALDKAIAIEMAMRDATELNSSSNCTIAVHAVKNVHTPKKNFHANKSANFPPCNSCVLLWIVKGGNNPLFGRNWLQQFPLKWHELKMLKENSSTTKTILSTYGKDKLGDLLKRHQNIFSDGIGKIKSATAKLTLKPDTQPKFCKTRPVPYALVQKVSTELDNLERQGMISKVEHSDWATPLVPVLKRTGVCVETTK